jgi:hypothetical protein
LSWRRNQLLILRFPGRFLLIASLKRRGISMNVSVFTVAIIRANPCKLYQQIPGTFWSCYIFYYSSEMNHREYWFLLTLVGSLLTSLCWQNWVV